MKAIRATSEFGFSMLNIIFEEDVEFYFARQRVLEKLSVASTFLPDTVEPYLAPDTTALGQVFWYTVEGEGYDIGRLRAIQDWFVKYQLYSVPGVAEVTSVGGFPIEYQVDVDPNKLRSYGLTLGELYGAVARSNSAVGGRVIQKGNSEYLVRSTGWIESLGDVETTVIKSIDGTLFLASHCLACCRSSENVISRLQCESAIAIRRFAAMSALVTPSRPKFSKTAIRMNPLTVDVRFANGEVSNRPRC